jgi:dihydroorotase
MLVLNIHGEVLESLAPADTTLEEAFLPTLKQLHDRFPQLRIVVCMPSSRSGPVIVDTSLSLSTALPPLLWRLSRPVAQLLAV